MIKIKQFLIISFFCFYYTTPNAYSQKATNPLIFADVPDMSIIRVNDNYYMSSTTMHMCPGVPVMKSNDLTNWKIIGYAYDILEDIDATRLTHGKSDYGRGSWASCLRFHHGEYYLSTFSHTTGKTYIFKTKNIESGQWKRFAFSPALHDHSIFFDDDGKIYIVWGAGTLKIAELKEDFSGLKEGSERVLIENASAPAGASIMLPAEGSQLFKVNGKYYLFNITWPWGGMRTVLVHRADNIHGPWEGRVAFQDRGIAQGGIIDMPDGRWFAYLFRDYGAVGRIPYLVPVRWEDGWPILGIDGKAPDTLDLPPSRGLIPGIVASDDFDYVGEPPTLSPVWQWNHNPDNRYWSLTQRKGYLRHTTSNITDNFEFAHNTLTQRTIGPACVGSIKMDVSHMKDGDFAGLALIQKNYGLVGVKYENGVKRLVMINAQKDNEPQEIENIPLEKNIVYLKAVCYFENMTDTAAFYYSTNGTDWQRIGNTLKMRYNLAHFMGYRFGLFNYATRLAGGYVDFDWFRIQEVYKP